MKEFLRLPYDSSGYGDFGVSYIGVEYRVHFKYRVGAEQRIGELYFDFCISALVNGILNKQISILYDTVFIEEFLNERYEGFHRYVFMLSGSDFQFEVIAKGCNFVESIERSFLIGVD